jgi:hypothetical protein
VAAVLRLEVVLVVIVALLQENHLAAVRLPNRQLVLRLQQITQSRLEQEDWQRLCLLLATQEAIQFFPRLLRPEEVAVVTGLVDQEQTAQMAQAVDQAAAAQELLAGVEVQEVLEPLIKDLQVARVM